jgi:DNA-binding LacI/PurR family transcriptional regulator
MGRPRLVDVAARAGVSRTAASTALGGSGRISERTRQHVIATAVEMGYKVNATARNLRTRRAGAVGLYLPGEVSGHEYYMQFAFGVVQRARQADVPVVLIFSGESDRSLGRDHVDGYIVVDALDDDPAVPRILAQGKPIVAAESLPDGCSPATATVAVDHEAALAELLAHLAQRGARRPALVAPPLNSSWARQLHRAYDAWCRETKVPERIVTAPFLATPESVIDPLEALFGSAESPDAVVCAQDGIATAVAGAVAARDYVIGEDVLLAAYVDGIAVRHYTPPITAIDLDPGGHGAACADLLLSLTENPDSESRPDPLSHRVQLHVRPSTEGVPGR